MSLRRGREWQAEGARAMLNGEELSLFGLHVVVSATTADPQRALERVHSTPSLALLHSLTVQPSA